MKKFRKKGFPHYAATSRILRDTTATGSNAYASTQSSSGTDSSDPEYKRKEEEDAESVEVSKSPKPKENSKSWKRDSYSAKITTSLNTLAERVLIYLEVELTVLKKSDQVIHLALFV